MRVILESGLFLFYIAVNISIAIWNKLIVDHRLRTGNPKQIEHPWWALGYVCVVAPLWFGFHSIYFISAVLLLHLSIFPVAYNIVTGEDAFHLSQTSRAVTDRMMVKAGMKNTFLVNLISFLVSIALLIKTFIHG